MNSDNFPVKKIVSGGQSGVDRAALTLALELSIEHGGWCPKGRQAEDGKIDHRFNLTETPLDDVNQRTEWNVRDSDGTLILTKGTPSGGTRWTVECADNYRKPNLTFELSDAPSDDQIGQFREWILQHEIKVLNIAGPRESLAPGVIYKRSYAFLKKLFGASNESYAQN